MQGTGLILYWRYIEYRNFSLEPTQLNLHGYDFRILCGINRMYDKFLDKLRAFFKDPVCCKSRLKLVECWGCLLQRFSHQVNILLGLKRIIEWPHELNVLGEKLLGGEELGWIGLLWVFPVESYQFTILVGGVNAFHRLLLILLVLLCVLHVI